jgi:hypothetical protein
MLCFGQTIFVHLSIGSRLGANRVFRGSQKPPFLRLMTTTRAGLANLHKTCCNTYLGEQMFEPAQVKTTIGVLVTAHPDRPASTWELLRSVLADGAESLDRRLEHPDG